LGRRLARPVASPAVWFRHVAPDTQFAEGHHRVVTVIPLVADDLRDPGRAHHRGELIPLLR
jgi:hypothetical protein